MISVFFVIYYNVLWHLYYSLAVLNLCFCRRIKKFIVITVDDDIDFLLDTGFWCLALK